MGLGRVGGLLLAVVALSIAGGEAAAQERCKGTKQYYAGKCRYPDEVRKLQAEDAARRRAAAARRRQAEEAKQRELLGQRDAGACDMARSTDTRAAWEAYLKAHPEGGCAAQANERLAVLAEPPSPTTPPTTDPGPPTPPPDGAATGSGDAGISPLAIVGFAVGGAGLVTWAVAGGISLSRSSALGDQCPDDKCPPEHQGELDDALLAAHVTTVGAVVTGVGAALSVIGLLTSGSSDGEASAGATIEPTVGWSALGVRGSF